MTSSTFFMIFIPILAVILLAVNLILAPHNPYQEKDSVFECGFHSFLGQNRTQFSVSFFIFGLLFLLFDLEILLVYPYSVSSYTNDIYGLAIMMIFFVLLTLGFIFELGKNALTIESRQNSSRDANTLDSYAYLGLVAQSNFTGLLVKKILTNLFSRFKNYILTNAFNFVYTKLSSHRKVLKYKNLIFSIINLCEIIYNHFTSRIDRFININFPSLYAMYVDFQFISYNVFAGRGYLFILYFLVLALYLGSEYVFYCTIIIQIYPLVKYYNDIFILPNYPRLSKPIDLILYIIYLAAIGICMDELYTGIINPLWSRFFTSMKQKWDGFLKVSNGSQDNVNLSGSSNNNPSPGQGPGDMNKSAFSDDTSKEKKRNFKKFTIQARKDHKAFEELAHKKSVDYRSMPGVHVDMLVDYFGYLSKEDQQELMALNGTKFPPLSVPINITAKDFWLERRRTNKVGWDVVVSQIKIWERNSKTIRSAMKKDNKNDNFPRDLEIFKNGWSTLHRQKEALIRSQLGQASQFDKLLKEKNKRFLDVLNNRD